MMIIYNGVNLDNTAIVKNLTRMTNQIYKLLPLREEGANWESALGAITEEIAGIMIVIPEFQPDLFRLNAKLEGLISLSDEKSFSQYRGVIFDCLNIVNELVKQCEN